MTTSFLDNAEVASPGRTPGALIEGWVVSITDEGQAIVDYPNNPEPPLPASSIVSVPREALGNLRVTLGFLEGDQSRPVITGVIQTAFVEDDAPTERSVAVVDGRRVEITADREIALICGKSSITLRRDGRVIIRGTKLWSRASEINRIHGANVRIN